jgi:hypothetical protein
MTLHPYADDRGSARVNGQWYALPNLIKGVGILYTWTLRPSAGNGNSLFQK